MKSTSVEDLRVRYLVEEVLDTGHPNTLTLDVTEMLPEVAARRILEHAAHLSLPGPRTQCLTAQRTYVHTLSITDR